MPATDDTYDELAAPHFEDRLWRLVADAHRRRNRSDTAHRRFDRSPARHGRRLLTVGLGTIAAAAAVITTVSIVGSGGAGVSTSDRRPGSESAEAAPPEVDLAAQITAATQEAAASSVVHTFQDDLDGPGDAEAWSDETSGVHRSLYYDEDGAPVFETGAVEPPATDAVAPPPLPEEDCASGQDVAELNAEELAGTLDCPPTIPPGWPMEPLRIVDHCFGEYQETEYLAVARNEAQTVGAMLERGELVEDGTEVVDGRELIRLRNPGDDVQHIYYIDPETHRPVQLHGYPDNAGVAYVKTFEYLPRTAENLALLVAPVPDGYVQVEQRRGDRAMSEAGCL